MASIQSSSDASNPTNQPQGQYYRFQMYYNPPLGIELSSKAGATTRNGRKYTTLKVFVFVNLSEKMGESWERTSIALNTEDWYRWMDCIRELLSKAKKIYVDGHVAEDVKEDDFKLVNFKGEVIQLIPLMAKVNEDLVPAVRVILNDPAKFADFPLIDIKSMYNVVSRVDVWTAGFCGSIIGESL